MVSDHPIFTKVTFRRALMAPFAILLASFRVWAVPPVQFAVPTNSPIGTIDPIAITAADLNGDGTMDLAVGSFMNNSLEILIGVGDGTFQTKTNYAVLGHSSRISVADFNHDNKPDLAFGGSAFLGTGDGGFLSVNIFTNSDTRHGWILGAGDFTGDGNADLVCVQPGTPIDPESGDLLSVWAGDGTGGFNALTNSYKLGFQPSDPFDGAIGDLNGDGRLDLVLYYPMPLPQNALSVLLGIGDGSFVIATNNNLVLMGGRVELGEFNGDGKPDCAAVSGAFELRLFLGDGTGAFQDLTNFDGLGPIASFVAIGDVNGDGHEDIVVATWGGLIEVFTGNGVGTFSSAFRQQSDVSYRADVQLADINGDGRPDIVVCYSEGVSVLLNRSLPTLGANLAGDQVKLVWPAWKGFGLEYATSLSATNSWFAVTNKPGVIGDQKVLSYSIGEGQRYFRKGKERKGVIRKERKGVRDD